MPDRDSGTWDYVLALPSDFRRTPGHGIDSKAEHWTAPGLEFGTDFGAYTGRPGPCRAAPCRQWRETISGFPAEVTRDDWAGRPGGPRHSLNVYIPVITRHGQPTLALGMIAGCESEAACDRALAVARTVRIVRREGR